MTGRHPTQTGTIGWRLLVMPVLAWAGLAIALVLAAGTTTIALTGDQRAGDWGLAVGLLLLVGVGCLVAARRPTNPVGWLLAAYGLGFEMSVFGETLTSAVYLAGRDLPGADVAAWIIAWNWAVGLCILGLAFLHFPDGRLPSRGWRIVRWAQLAAITFLLTAAVTLWPQRGVGFLGMATGLPGDVPWALDGIGLTLLQVSMPLALVSLGVRYWRGDREQRQQLKWLVPSLAVMVGAVAIFMVAGRGPTVNSAVTALGEILFVLGVAGLVLSMALAIFKYRLYDIDRIVSRTVAYVLVTAVLTGTYAVTVVALRTLFGPVTGTSDLAVASSTLVVAALFGPVRRQVQAVVDRRFNRRRYDATRAVEAFGQRLRDEVDLDDVRAELRSTVGRTLQPRTMSVWVAERGAP